MRDIAGLRQARAKLVDEADGIAIGANSTSEDLDRIDSLQRDIALMDRRITTAESTARARSASALPAPSATEDLEAIGGMQPLYAQPRETVEPGIRFAQCTRALVNGRGDPAAGHRWAMAAYGERHPVTQEIGAVLSANDASSGGFLVPEKFSAEIIDLLLPATTMRKAVAANGNVVPLVGGTDNFPTVESGITGYYIGENQDKPISEPTFGNVRMTERELVALVPISHKLLRHASVNVDAMVRNLIVRGLAQTEDLAFLRGTGLGAGPKGLRYQMASANILTMTATPTYLTIDTDARRMELQLMQADILPIDPRWIMSPRVLTYLRDLRDTNGNHVYEDLTSAKFGNSSGLSWKGYPVLITNNVPRNLGGGTESELYLVDFGYMLIADSFTVRIDASDTAAYKDGTTLVSAFSRNQTVIKATAGHDFAMQRTQAAAVLTGVTWGA